MELLQITLQFESEEEQEFFENNLPFDTYERETWDEDSGFTSWTTFDISGCDARDLLKIDKVANKWYEKN